MKISDYKVGTSFEVTCTKRFHPYNKEWYYESFEISKQHASIWGRKPEDVITVKATIIEEDIIFADKWKDKSYDSNSIDYFGFIDFDNEDGELHIHMIYPNIKQYYMCFPYGADAARFWSHDVKDPDTFEIIHHAGDRKGMTVRLKIEEI